MICGYLGPQGSYSYLALTEGFPEMTPEACDTFSEIIEKVDTGAIAAGLLPVENSTEGAVTAVMDSLLTLQHGAIQAEVIYTVCHHLFMAEKDEAAMNTAYSHPQAIEQCRHFFRTHYPGVKLVPCESTSTACLLAKEAGNGTAAIASRWAGLHHGLKPVRGNIQDNRFNQTRFVLLGTGTPQPTGNDKTAIAFSFHRDTAGNLYEILKIFAEANVNLTRIESRPAKMELGQYVFFIDFEGHQQEPAIGAILEKLRLLTRTFIIFGSFPRAQRVLGED
ncbi:prephenate dehydratase [Anoxynatronum buryatiense]|uniref:Prephenate dehydratase n=1 Tax=Anoxynatronum buryatiense TaxID=489973 RepID=A0AA45WYA8_9CLOT|nr:prephenate dehydratase [Anoxynatronum buryatiense]SMP68160.1 prephenate dehydratase [Anoxynatronum buryatiense]